MKKIRGLTFIELLTALMIVVIITVIAITLYTKYVQRGRRIDGIGTILSMMLAEERYRSSNSQYGTIAQVWGGITTSPAGYYTLAISNVSPTGYTITATAIGNQANDTVNGISCSSLTLTVASGVITQSPPACWPQ